MSSIEKEQFALYENLFESIDGKMTEKKRRVLITAMILFEKKGYASTSTKEIAQNAEVSEATIFKHFQTKEGLMLTLVEYILGSVLTSMFSTGIDELIEDEYDSIETFLSNLFENRLKLIHQGLPFFKIIVQEIPFQPKIRAKMIDLIKSIPFTKIFEKLKNKDLIVDIPDDVLLKIIVSCIIGYFISHFLFIPEFFDDTQEQEMKYFTDFMARGLGK